MIHSPDFSENKIQAIGNLNLKEKENDAATTSKSSLGNTATAAIFSTTTAGTMTSSGNTLIGDPMSFSDFLKKQSDNNSSLQPHVMNILFSHKGQDM
jgi:hypothetical protein